MDKLNADFKFVTAEDLENNEIITMFRDIRPAPGMMAAHVMERVKEWVEFFGVYNAVRILQYQLKLAMHACEEGRIVVGYDNKGNKWTNDFTDYAERFSCALGEDPDYEELMVQFKLQLASSPRLREHWQNEDRLGSKPLQKLPLI